MDLRVPRTGTTVRGQVTRAAALRLPAGGRREIYVRHHGAEPERLCQYSCSRLNDAIGFSPSDSCILMDEHGLGGGPGRSGVDLHEPRFWPSPRSLGYPDRLFPAHRRDRPARSSFRIDMAELARPETPCRTNIRAHGLDLPRLLHPEPASPLLTRRSSARHPPGYAITAPALQQPRPTA